MLLTYQYVLIARLAFFRGVGVSIKTDEMFEENLHEGKQQRDDSGRFFFQRKKTKSSVKKERRRSQANLDSAKVFANGNGTVQQNTCGASSNSKKQKQRRPHQLR